MGSKGQHHGVRRPSKVFNQVGKREKDFAKPEILEAEPCGGITTSTNGEEACKVSRGEGGKAIRQDQGQEAFRFIKCII